MRDEDFVARGLQVQDELNKSWNQQRYGDKEPYITMSIRVIRNPEYRSVMRGPETLFNYLRAFVIRGDLKKDRLKIKEHYYDKCYLACCFSYEQLADACFLHRQTVQKYIEDFEKARMIRIDRVGRKKIFVLGMWYIDKEGRYKEKYFFEDVF
jgi:hypothetical protein